MERTFAWFQRKYRRLVVRWERIPKIFGSPKIGSAKPVRSLIPDRFFETIFVQDYQKFVGVCNI